MDEMQLILVISKGADMKSKFPLEKRGFFPSVPSPHSVFPYENFLAQEGWEDICSLGCLNINLYFFICVRKRERQVQWKSYKCTFFLLDRAAPERAVMLVRARDVICFDRTSLLRVSEVLTCSSPTILDGVSGTWVGLKSFHYCPNLEKLPSWAESLFKSDICVT